MEENTEIYCVSKILVNSEFVFALFSVSIFSESPPVHHYAKLLCCYTQTFQSETYLLILEFLAGDSAPLRSCRKYCGKKKITAIKQHIWKIWYSMQAKLKEHAISIDLLMPKQ